MPHLDPKRKASTGAPAGQISFFSGVLVMLLVLVLLGLSMSSIGRVISNLNDIANHPFQVVEQTGSLRSLTEQTSLIMTRFRFTNTPDVVEDVRQRVDAFYAKMDPLLDEIQASYMGPGEDVAVSYTHLTLPTILRV